ncbi:hypothetical protein [Tamaricihabitans halophyticus]|uniref:hypothetical protein n=1 Tax=Tamaricihabitans halophyticus TaxID=1262583 RepID=UPI0010533010|nr:hypothetical protein [Tamaricihabitans halophyticus]
MAFIVSSSATASPGCRDCAADLDHCHGTLLTHQDGPVQCTDAACRDDDPARHRLQAGCAELAYCECVAPQRDDFYLAS